MEIKFKVATKSDIPEILKMMEDFNAIDNYPFDREVSKKNLNRFLADTSLGRIWMVEMGNSTAGYVVLTFGFSFEYQGRDGFIDELFIKENYRNKGIGKKTLDFISAESHKLHINVIHLEVESHNKNANILYLKSGFISNNRTLLTRRLN